VRVVAFPPHIGEAIKEHLRKHAQWGRDEFWGQADPKDLAAVLEELAGLAARAERDRERLDCWVCV
jgi:hypothetical protein